MQCHYKKNEDKYQSHDNKEGVEPAVMSRWREPMEKKSRKDECRQITNQRNNKKSNIPIYTMKIELKSVDECSNMKNIY